MFKGLLKENRSNHENESLDCEKKNLLLITFSSWRVRSSQSNYGNCDQHQKKSCKFRLTFGVA